MSTSASGGYKPLRIIQVGEHVRRQERKYASRLWALAALAVVMCAALAVWLSGLIPAEWHVAHWSVGVVIGVVVILGVVNALAGRVGRPFKSYQEGRSGEERVVATLGRYLDGEWTLYRNLELPGGKGDIDLLLVGPGGIWVLEVKSYTRRVQNIGDSWKYWSGRQLRPLDVHPGRQARGNARRIKEYLAQYGGVDIPWVEPVVVWAGGGNLLYTDRPATKVWRLPQVPDQLRQIVLKHSLSAEQLQAVTEALQQTIQGKESSPQRRNETG